MEAQMGRKGYIFAEFDITDSERFYAEYMPRVRPLLDAYSARFLIATNEPDVLEGDRSYGRVILVEFDSPEQAQKFYYSKEYQDIIAYRLETSRGSLYILDGAESS
jgi:uncharacterized protein (DUF1330 family)